MSNKSIENFNNFFKKISDTSNIFELDLFKMHKEKVKIDFLVENLFVKNRVILINARRGSRKTTFLYALARALASDYHDFLGYKINRDHRYEIFYFDAENPLSDVLKFTSNLNSNNFHVFSNALNDLPKFDVSTTGFKPLCFCSKNVFKQLVQEHFDRLVTSNKITTDKLNSKQKLQYIEKFYEKYTCNNFKQCISYYHHLIFWSKVHGYHPILIFDALSYFKGRAKENSDEMITIMQKFKELRDYGATVFVLQNSGKSETSASRGFSGIEDLVDATFQIVSPHDPVFSNSSEYYHFKCLGKSRGTPSDISLYIDFYEDDTKIEITNKTSLQKENLEYIVLSQIARNERISKFELIQKIKHITSKSNRQHKKINDIISYLINSKLITYEKINKEGKGRPTTYYQLSSLGEKKLEEYKNTKEHSFVILKPEEPEENIDINISKEDELKEKDDSDKIIHSDGVFTVIQRSTPKPPEQTQHKPRNPNCQKCAPSDCQYFAEENRYWCHWFRKWCDEVKEGRR